MSEKPRITRHQNGQVWQEAYYRNRRLHKEDGPALTIYYETGQTKLVQYWQNGEKHRCEGAAATSWYPKGQIDIEEYWLNGECHRDDGPAEIGWFENGIKDFECYYRNGALHRVDGPAIVDWDESGAVVELTSWVAGWDRNMEAATAINFLGISADPDQWSAEDRAAFSQHFIQKCEAAL